MSLIPKPSAEAFPRQVLPWERHRTSIDEGIEAIVMSLELLTRDVKDLKSTTQQDAESIRALARIVEIHKQRLSHLEGGE